MRTTRTSMSRTFLQRGTFWEERQIRQQQGTQVKVGACFCFSEEKIFFFITFLIHIAEGRSVFVNNFFQDVLLIPPWSCFSASNRRGG